jgi:hypothetical protein
MPGDAQPLTQGVAIVKDDGSPTDYFIRWAQERQIDITAGITAAQAEQLIVDYLAAHPIQAGTGIAITPSGNLADDPTVSLDAVLDDLNDVDTVTAPPTDGQALVWVDADALWKPGDVASGGGGGGVEAYYNSNNTSTVVNPTPVPPTAVISVTVNASTIARVFSVQGEINWRTGAHGMRGHILLDGVQVWPNVVVNNGIDPITTGDGQDVLVFSGINIPVPGDGNAHTIALSWESQGATTAITLENRHISAINMASPKQWPGNVIQEYVCAGGETEVVLSNIPQTFRDLQLRAVARVNAAGNDVQMKIQCNGDTGNNYAHQQVFANGATLTGVRSTGVSAIVWMQATGNSNTLPNLWASGHFDFGDYRSTLHNKTGFGNSYNRDTDTRELTYSGEWRSNNAITSIRVFPNSGSFTAGTVITLYGIGGPGSATIYNRPWYWSPPAASSFALQSGDATMPILADDLDVGLLFNANTPVVGDEVRMAYRTLTSKALDWSLTVRMNWNFISASAALGIYLHDSVGGRAIEWGWVSSGSDLLLRGRLNSLTSFSVSTSTTARGYANWLRVARVGANLLYYLSTDGKLWTLFLTETIAAWLANDPDRVGVGVRFNNATYPVLYSVDHFALTGPAV